MYIPSSIMKFKAGLGISMLLILGLQSSTAQAQQFCSKELCISATIFSKDNKTIEFSLTAQIDSVGWVGMGLGGVSGGMAGNDLALCWPDPSGSGALISQRSAIMNGPPTALPTSAFKVQQAKSGVTSNRFMCTFYRPLLLSTSTITSDLKTIGIVFAVGMKPPIPGANGDPQKASFQEHTFTGSGALVIARKEGSSTDYMPTPSATPTPKPTRTPGAGTGNSPSPDAAEVVRTQEQIDALILSHASMMAIAFLIILPLGAMLVRFFSHLHNVFVWHRPIQATGVLLVLAALGCILAALAKKSALNDTPMEQSLFKYA
ncbi:hypothetical protein FBU30_008399 [Linnemannia zychae]|nr:hypothetical protein FBU30_008399 [Linnemannia zychae]